MLRCVLASMALAAAVPVAAQSVNRNFPATALRGELVLQQPPEALLNGVPARLSPGARIRGTNNLLVMSGAIVGQPYLVHYTLDDQGLVHLVWILSDAELAKKPWPVTLQQQKTWVFDPVGQTWSKP
ncbi:hypothetical protein BurJ1DRAFT_4365 [Burkholderiales bacterium JOSHI_001]|nr:hypothetical protein BurJ1DRAFT_4365 [Burkholderiales bacterium JOSHI_001]